MDFIYDSGKAISLFVLPFVIYMLLTKNNGKSKHTNRDWYYYVKLCAAKRMLKRHLDNCSKRTAKLGESWDKQILGFPSSLHVQSQYIYGADHLGNNISLRFILRANRVCEIFICLRTADGKIYSLPPESNCQLFSLPKDQWKAKGLSIEVLEPYKKLRIVYIGPLKDIKSNSEDSIQHVQFNLIWKAAGGPRYFPQDADLNLLANGIATESWNDGSWIEFFPDLLGYEQFGSLFGFIRGEKFPEDQILNLPSYRGRYDSTIDNIELRREIRLFIAGEDGTLINLIIKSLKNGSSQTNYGNVMLNNGEVYAITNTDIFLSNIAPEKNFPNMFKINITVPKKDFICVLHLNKAHLIKATVSGKLGYELFNIPSECDLNSQQAKALVELWYDLEGHGLNLPPPVLSSKEVEDLPSDYVVNIKSESAKISELTGGKGNSLALLSSLNSNKFTIPEGFIVTTNAFKKQLQNHKTLTEAIKEIEEHKHEAKLEDYCSRAIELFKAIDINEEIVSCVKKELEYIQSNLEDLDIEEIRWAVRSSAVGEDSEELSAAGQNETFLGCSTTEEVLKSISACWASLYTFQSVQYRWQHGIDIQAQMAVVVQRMVPAKAAGVLFTHHPATSNSSQIVITSNFGLGESVVSGSSEPDTYVLKRKWDGKESLIEAVPGVKNKIIRMNDEGVETVDNLEKQLSLSEKEAEYLAEVGVLIEEAYGNARDIEWAFYKDKLYILQSRPITTINTWSDFELLHEQDVAFLTNQNVFTVANVGEVCPGALTVLSQTTSLVLLELGLQLSILKSQDKNYLKCISIFQHHVMLNVINSVHKQPKGKIDIATKIIDLAVFGHPVINEDINKISVNRFGMFSSLKQARETLKMIRWAWNNQSYLKKMKQWSRNFKISIEENDSLKEICQKIDKAIEDSSITSVYHCYTSAASIFYQMVAMVILVEDNEDLNSDHYADIAAILSSCKDVVSAEVPQILENIHNVIYDHKLLEEFSKLDPEEGEKWLEKKCPEAYVIFKKFLEKHGHRLLGEFELMEDTWGMKPSTVIKMLQANNQFKNKQKKQIESIDDVLNKLVSPKKNSTKKILKFIISKMRRAVGIRESSKSEVIRTVNKIRIAYRHLAEKMVSEGIIPSKDLIYHLTNYEIKEIIERKNPLLITKAMRRQRLHSQWKSIRFPEIMYGFPVPENNENVVDLEGDFVVGTPVCNGDVTARACVITSLDEIHQLKSGDILITYSTDIGWSPYFPILSGIVTELGGLVSHGAVVAREYGLPCIVGVKNITKMFRTGDIVSLSGKTGKICLNKPSAL